MSDEQLYVPHVRRKISDKDLIRATLPRENWGARVDLIQDAAVRPIVSRYCKYIDKMAGKGFGLFVTGDPGVGKTSLAAVVLKEALRRYLSGYFITFTRLRSLQFDDKNLLVGDGSDGVTIREHLVRTDFLVLDGFTLDFFEDRVFGPEKLVGLVNERRSMLKTTVMTASFGDALSKLESAGDVKHALSAAMQPVRIRGKNMFDKRREEMAKLIVGGD